METDDYWYSIFSSFLDIKNKNLKKNLLDVELFKSSIGSLRRRDSLDISILFKVFYYNGLLYHEITRIISFISVGSLFSIDISFDNKSKVYWVYLLLCSFCEHDNEINIRFFRDCMNFINEIPIENVPEFLIEEISIMKYQIMDQPKKDTPKGLNSMIKNPIKEPKAQKITELPHSIAQIPAFHSVDNDYYLFELDDLLGNLNNIDRVLYLIEKVSNDFSDIRKICNYFLYKDNNVEQICILLMWIFKDEIIIRSDEYFDKEIVRRDYFFNLFSNFITKITRRACITDEQIGCLISLINHVHDLTQNPTYGMVSCVLCPGINAVKRLVFLIFNGLMQDDYQRIASLSVYAMLLSPYPKYAIPLMQYISIHHKDRLIKIISDNLKRNRFIESIPFLYDVDLTKKFATCFGIENDPVYLQLSAHIRSGRAAISSKKYIYIIINSLCSEVDLNPLFPDTDQFSS